jgi:hypothetical protein
MHILSKNETEEIAQSLVNIYKNNSRERLLLIFLFFICFYFCIIYETYFFIIKATNR